VIAKIQPAFFDLHFDPGTLGKPTTYALGLFTVLFLLHAGGLVRYEVKRLPAQPTARGAAPREPVSV
ncbi:MAG: hypothetical protein LC640_02020, partial [Frankia sp.]|nr:hypothetical protein [Frankia sp.]